MSKLFLAKPRQELEVIDIINSIRKSIKLSSKFDSFLSEVYNAVSEAILSKSIIKSRELLLEAYSSITTYVVSEEKYYLINTIRKLLLKRLNDIDAYLS